MATKFNGWTDYAVLSPTVPKYKKDGTLQQWKVQINAEGRFRCSCPAYIFCKGAERTCKHCRKCEETRTQEKVGGGMMTPVPMAKPVWNPFLEEATKATAAMLTAGRLYADAKQTEQMVEALAARLRTFNGGAAVRAAAQAAMPVPTTQTVTVGIRHITFED